MPKQSSLDSIEFSFISVLANQREGATRILDSPRKQGQRFHWRIILIALQFNKNEL